MVLGFILYFAVYPYKLIIIILNKIVMILLKLYYKKNKLRKKDMEKHCI